MQSVFNGLKDFFDANAVEIVRKVRSPKYAFRLLVYDKKTHKLLSDRTFKGHSEDYLLATFTAHIAKNRLLRRYTPSKVILRLTDTSTHLIPLKMFARIENETQKKEGKTMIVDSDEVREKLEVES